MGTVSKALSLLDFFSRSQPEIGLSELTRASGLNKATVYRLLSDLQIHGFVEQTGARAYRLGPAVLRLAAIREATVPMRQIVQATLDRLSDTTGETSHLAQIQGDRLVTLAYAYSPAHGTAVRMEDAAVTPFHATATGLAVLAFAGPAFCDRRLAQPLPAFTPDTPTDPADIRARLGRIRASGYSESVGGFEADVHSLAVPLFDATACIGAVAVATPKSRMTPALRARIIAALFDAAHDIVALWGGFLPDELQRLWVDAV
ncbi:MAG: IclR family transcriptional regulator [Rhodobacter sp.]|nr:IclR family transcriptional regulator [Rhodobacter sp.]